MGMGANVAGKPEGWTVSYWIETKPDQGAEEAQDRFLRNKDKSLRFTISQNLNWTDEREARLAKCNYKYKLGSLGIGTGSDHESAAS